jgi:hypothetical protein
MVDSPAFILTHQTLAEWEKEKAQLEEEIAAKQRKHAFIVERLKAAAVLMEKGSNLQEPIAADDGAKSNGADPSNLIHAVDLIANTSSRPISKHDVKKRLMEMGFPESRLGNYFYTTIARLKERQRNTVTSNGHIWRGPDRDLKG